MNRIFLEATGNMAVPLKLTINTKYIKSLFSTSIKTYDSFNVKVDLNIYQNIS